MSNCTAPIFCPGLTDSQLYALEDPPLASVKCPPGLQSGTVTLNCCGHVLTADVSAMPPAQKQATINDLISQCLRSLAFCKVDTCDNDNDPGDPSEGTPLDPCNFQFSGNNPTQVTAQCPNGGGTYTFTAPGCSVLAGSQSDADFIARQLANAKVQQAMICLNDIPRCLCVGVPYSATLTTSTPQTQLTWTVTGVPPPGLVIHTGKSVNLVIDGTPIAGGLYGFIITAKDDSGGQVQKLFTLSVLAITTTVLPPITIGSPFSFQLFATGGSGNYTWTVFSGTLPTGLSLSPSGLITGTPTDLGVSPVVFAVSDPACEALSPVNFPPSASFSTVSVTTIATVLGYPEYIASAPPKKYHTLTWSGQAEQTAVVWSSKQQLADAKIVYSGSGQIDTHGNQTSNYTKDLYLPCPGPVLPFAPFINSIPAYGLNTLLGYCWPPDPKSCNACSSPPAFVKNIATNDINDVPGFANAAFNPVIRTPTTLTDTSTDSNLTASIEEGGIGGVTPGTVPLSNVNGQTTTWILLAVVNNYSAVLSNEYTDAEALANALVVTSNGTTAENLPRTTGYVSRFTKVNYTVTLTNLVNGRQYTVTLRLRDNNFVPSVITLSVTATSSIATVDGVLPTPPAGGTLTILSASAALTVLTP